MSGLGTLVPEQPCYVFQTHTHEDKQRTQGPFDWYPFIYINTTCHVLTAAVCITFIIICIKNLLSTMCFLLKNYSLVESVCLEVLPAKHNTDRNNVKEQNRHWKGGGESSFEPGCFWILIFWKSKRRK